MKKRKVSELDFLLPALQETRLQAPFLAVDSHSVLLFTVSSA